MAVKVRPFGLNRSNFDRQSNTPAWWPPRSRGAETRVRLPRESEEVGATSHSCQVPHLGPLAARFGHGAYSDAARTG